MKRNCWLLWGAVFLFPFSLLADQLLVKPETVAAQGRFHRTTSQEGGSWEDQSKASLPRFTTYPPMDKGMGSLQTDWFLAPEVLQFYVAGYPVMGDVKLYLQEQGSERNLQLRTRLDPAFTYRLRQWVLPTEWRGKQVRLMAEDHSTTGDRAWVSVTLPEAGHLSYSYALGRAVYRSAFLVVQALLFLLPGVALCLFMLKRWILPVAQVIAVILAGSCLAGYLVFWPYLLHYQLGHACSVLAPLLSAAVIGWNLRDGISRHVRMLLPEVSLCFGAVTLVAVFSMSAGFLYTGDDGAVELAQVRYLEHILPSDNVLPIVFADHLYYNVSVKPGLLSALNHSSDRPPLEAGLVLEEYPYWLLFTKSLSYELFGIWLQCTWVAGMWVLFRRAGAGTRALSVVIVMAALSQFCLVHTFFVWPKLLSAAFCLIFLSCFPWIRNDQSHWTKFDVALSASAIGLSLLGHMDCVFTFLAVLLITLVRRQIPQWRVLIPGFAILLALLVPWKLYQTFYDPTQDTLAKLHLTGVTDANVSLPQAFVQSYRLLTIGEFLTAKQEDIHRIVGEPLGLLHTSNLKSFLSVLVANTFYSVVFGIGVMHVGWLARVFARRERVLQLGDNLMWIALFSCLIWVLIMFQPGATMIHQGSFAQMLLFFAALTIYLLRAKWFLWPAVAVQAFVLFPLYILAKPILQAELGTVWDQPLDSGMLTVMLLSGMTFAAGIWYAFRRLPADSSFAVPHEAH